TSPVANSTVNRSHAIVTGTITTTADEVGVVVNHVVSKTQGSQFAALAVPLIIGSNTITATATNSCHSKAVASATISTTQFQDPRARFTIDHSMGVAPLTVNFKVDVSALQNPVSTFQWDFD